MYKNRYLNTIGVIVVSLLVVFFWIAYRENVTKNAHYYIGVILAKTGKADFIGKPEAKVLEEIEKETNIFHFRKAAVGLIIKDSGGNLEQAVKIFDSFSQDNNCLAVIGPSTSGESIPLAETAEQRRIPLLSLAASNKIVTTESGAVRRWVFKFAQNDILAAERLANVIQNKKQYAVALIYSDDGFGKSGAAAFRSVIERGSPIRIVFERSYSSQQSQFQPMIDGLPSEVQAVMIWGTAPGPALIVKALSLKQRKPQIYLSHGNASVDFITSTGPASEGAIIVGSRVLLDSKFLDKQLPEDEAVLRYKEFWNMHEFGGTPSHFGGHAYDAIEALKVAMKDKEDCNRDIIRERLEGLNNFTGVTGIFNFSPSDHAGLDVRAFETYVIHSGAFERMRTSE